MQRGMADYAAMGNRFGIPFHLGLLGEQVGRSGTSSAA